MTPDNPNPRSFGRWLFVASTVTLATPPVALFVAGILYRFGKIVSGQFVEAVFAVGLYAGPALGLILLLLLLVRSRTKWTAGASPTHRRTLLFAVLSIVSPLWLFLILMLITAFNR